MCAMPNMDPPAPANRASQVGKSAAGALVDPEKMAITGAGAPAPAGTMKQSFLNTIFGLQQAQPETAEKSPLQKLMGG